MGAPGADVPAEAWRELAALLAGDQLPAEELPRAALLVAQQEYPRLRIETALAELERLAGAFRQRLEPRAPPRQQLVQLNELLFGEEGFRGNVAAYYDPRNSYLNEVLERRLGLPITLSLVYIEVGRRAGLPLRGVGFPAHFLVLYEGLEPALEAGAERAREPQPGFEQRRGGSEPEAAAGPDPLLVDPFNSGRLLRRADCEAILHQTFGETVRFDPSQLAPSSPRDILARLLANLKGAYLRQGDLERALRSSELLSLVLPSATEIRERGLMRYHQGDLLGASRDLSRYLEFASDAADAETVRHQLRHIWELRARRN